MISLLTSQIVAKIETNYLHWQICVCFNRKLRLAGVKSFFGGTCHAELSRSDAAREYVWKDDTAIEQTRFELGELPLRRSDKRDWDRILESAKSGKFNSIPSDVLVRYYGSIKRIRQDNLQPVAMERSVHVFWGNTGLGKSRRAWAEAGMDAYPKDPRTKFWDGYNGQKHVVIDEFRGGIDVAHLLRWLDRYPVIVEIKGSSTCLVAECIWITSNLSPNDWYPDLDIQTRDALHRRLNVVHFDSLWTDFE